MAMNEGPINSLSPATLKIVEKAQYELAFLTHHGQAIAYMRLAEVFLNLATGLVLEAAPTYEDSGT